jgi:hypothetical protein
MVVSNIVLCILLCLSSSGVLLPVSLDCSFFVAPSEEQQKENKKTQYVLDITIHYVQANTNNISEAYSINEKEQRLAGSSISITMLTSHMRCLWTYLICLIIELFQSK